MIDQDLVQLGLSTEETAVYLSLLELGGAYASAIARKSEASRVNCYYILDKLKKKGLITSYIKDSVKYFIAEPPKVLVNQMEEKYERAQRILPELLSIQKSFGFKPIIHFYEGVEGLKTIFDQTLNAKSEVLGYTNLEALSELLPEYLPGYTQSLVKNKITMRLLSPSTPKAQSFIQNYYPKNFNRDLAEIFFIDPDEFPFENQISIYDNFVAIISLNPDELIGVLIESAVYARTQRAVFNLSWLGATAYME